MYVLTRSCFFVDQCTIAGSYCSRECDSSARVEFASETINGKGELKRGKRLCARGVKGSLPIRPLPLSSFSFFSFSFSFSFSSFFSFSFSFLFLHLLFLLLLLLLLLLISSKVPFQFPFYLRLIKSKIAFVSPHLFFPRQPGSDAPQDNEIPS